MKQGEAEAYAREWKTFLLRLGLIAVLLTAFLEYRRRSGRVDWDLSPAAVDMEGPFRIPEGRLGVKVQEALLRKAMLGDALPAVEAFRKQAAARAQLDAVLPGGATLGDFLDRAEELARMGDGLKGGEPLTEEQAEAIRREAEAGVAGPAIEEYLRKAGERGDLDRIKVAGKSLKEYLGDALDLADKVEALNEHTRRLQAEALGIDPDAEDPDEAVSYMVKNLGSSDPDERLMAVQSLCDNRLAKRAEAAVPALERAAQDPDEEIREFAKIALMRVRFWESKRAMRRRR